ncbi:hypothetical protein DC498_02990 [Terrimonas sp.]|uniref:transglutaminase-like domain-containing protein n=1 Tax=Terrimonas sp. TaxID=1914338 RepID=UPI000D516DA2|nr:transglutaminase-like domain-containing protein [Terrimonas sp.]PVD53500.1 hypothetical protein DC498_02990 [Terrimonas sp.]
MNKITGKLLVLALLLNFLHSVAYSVPGKLHTADADDNNVVIKSKTERYEFVYGNADNPVIINEQTNTIFRCEGYRTDLPYVEFYDDQSTINEVNIFIDGKKNRLIKPVYEYYSIENIFYSDARICYFQLPLEKKGSQSEVQISKTINDPRYFSTIYFSEPFRIENKQVIVTVPQWMSIDIKEMNFDGYKIKKQTEKKDNAVIYTYTIEQLEARKNEPRSPGPSYIYPHLLVLTRSADVKGKKITYFNALADQYAWYRHLVLQIGNDAAVIKEKAKEITKAITNDTAKIKAIFHYVQDNIRYIAFEDGIAGFKPEKAQEVLKKKYGDCKGMANLTKELLQAAGFDARLCWIGTNHIAYDYSTPSLSVDNHMICALRYKGKLYFLDATETYIGFDQYAERIQGRQVMIEDGEKYMLEKVPLRSTEQNIDLEKRTVHIDGNNLKGNVLHKMGGESKEWLLTRIHSLKKDKLATALQHYLAEGNQKYAITQLQTSDLNERDNALDINYQLDHEDAVSGFGDELYIDLDFRKDMDNADIDINKRTTDLVFSYKKYLIYETELTIPSGYKINQLPEGLNIDEPAYSFKINYKTIGEKLVYRKEITIKDTRLRKAAFAKWNASISQLKKSYNEQIILTKK